MICIQEVLLDESWNTFLKAGCYILLGNLSVRINGGEGAEQQQYIHGKYSLLHLVWLLISVQIVCKSLSLMNASVLTPVELIISFTE